MSEGGFWRQVEGGVELFVRLTPKSSRDAVESVRATDDGRKHLIVRVRAVPEDGKANKALIRLVSKTIGVPASALEIVAGHTSRLKTLRIACEPGEAEKKFALFAEF